MNTKARSALFLLRITLGSLFFYAGVSKLVDPTWSAAGYLKGAQTLQGFYVWLASAPIIGTVDVLNKWGLTLIGVALVVGLFTKLASYAGILMMALYYIPILAFPYVGAHSLIVDEHIVYIVAFVVLITTHAGKIWGIDGLRR